MKELEVYSIFYTTDKIYISINLSLITDVTLYCQYKLYNYLYYPLYPLNK